MNNSEYLHELTRDKHDAERARLKANLARLAAQAPSENVRQRIADDIGKRYFSDRLKEFEDRDKN